MRWSGFAGNIWFVLVGEDGLGLESSWGLASGGDMLGWSYPEPTRAFAPIRDALSFYPGRVECYVDGERVRPQPGQFYGGWVTDDIVGPMKGEPGTGHW